MTRYTLRALAAQWRAWSGTVAVLALAAGLVNVCLVHRMTVTRPDVVAAAWVAGVDPAELTVPGVSVAFYTTMVTVPVVAVVGQSCVQALRTSRAHRGHVRVGGGAGDLQNLYSLELIQLTEIKVFFTSVS